MFEVDGAGCLGHRSASTAWFNFWSCLFSQFLKWVGRGLCVAEDPHQLLRLFVRVSV